MSNKTVWDKHTFLQKPRFWLRWQWQDFKCDWIGIHTVNKKSWEKARGTVCDRCARIIPNRKNYDYKTKKGKNNN